MAHIVRNYAINIPSTSNLDVLAKNLSNNESNKTCHRDRIVPMTAPCPSHKKLECKNFNILLTPMPTPTPGVVHYLAVPGLRPGELKMFCVHNRPHFCVKFKTYYDKICCQDSGGKDYAEKATSKADKTYKGIDPFNTTKTLVQSDSEFNKI